MITLDKVLDNAMELSSFERESLIEILQKRRIEERREGISNEVREAQGAYERGNLKSSGADDAIEELHTFLSSPDDNKIE